MRRWMIFVAMALMTFAMACESGEREQVPHDSRYGEFIYDGEPYPVSEVILSDEGFVAVMLLVARGEGDLSSTYAVVGVNPELEGVSIDVERMYHNDDYYFVFESPVVFYSNYKALQSGTIMVQRQESGSVGVELDVVLADGKSFSYSNM